MDQIKGLEQSPGSYNSKTNGSISGGMARYCEIMALTLDYYLVDSRWWRGKEQEQKRKPNSLTNILKTIKPIKMPKLWNGIKQKDMIGIPWQLALHYDKKLVFTF